MKEFIEVTDFQDIPTTIFVNQINFIRNTEVSTYDTNTHIHFGADKLVITNEKYEDVLKKIGVLKNAPKLRRDEL